MGFYQILKLTIIPIIIVLQRLRGEREDFSSRALLFLAVTAVGVAAATISDGDLRGTDGVFLMGARKTAKNRHIYIFLLKKCDFGDF